MSIKVQNNNYSIVNNANNSEMNNNTITVNNYHSDLNDSCLEKDIKKYNKKLFCGKTSIKNIINNKKKQIRENELIYTDTEESIFNIYKFEDNELNIDWLNFKRHQFDSYLFFQFNIIGDSSYLRLNINSKQGKKTDNIYFDKNNISFYIQVKGLSKKEIEKKADKKIETIKEYISSFNKSLYSYNEDILNYIKDVQEQKNLKNDNLLEYDEIKSFKKKYNEKDIMVEKVIPDISILLFIMISYSFLSLYSEHLNNIEYSIKNSFTDFNLSLSFLVGFISVSIGLLLIKKNKYKKETKYIVLNTAIFTFFLMIIFYNMFQEPYVNSTYYFIIKSVFYIFIMYKLRKKISILMNIKTDLINFNFGVFLFNITLFYFVFKLLINLGVFHSSFFIYLIFIFIIIMVSTLFCLTRKIKFKILIDISDNFFITSFKKITSFLIYLIFLISFIKVFVINSFISLDVNEIFIIKNNMVYYFNDFNIFNFENGILNISTNETSEFIVLFISSLLIFIINNDLNINNKEEYIKEDFYKEKIRDYFSLNLIKLMKRKEKENLNYFIAKEASKYKDLDKLFFINLIQICQGYKNIDKIKVVNDIYLLNKLNELPYLIASPYVKQNIFNLILTNLKIENIPEKTISVEDINNNPYIQFILINNIEKIYNNRTIELKNWIYKIENSTFFPISEYKKINNKAFDFEKIDEKLKKIIFNKDSKDKIKFNKDELFKKDYNKKELIINYICNSQKIYLYNSKLSNTERKNFYKDKLKFVNCENDIFIFRNKNGEIIFKYL